MNPPEQIHGTWDDMPQPKPLVKKVTYTPDGERWPWYPRFVVPVTYISTETSHGETRLVFEENGPTVRGRVGLRRWFKHHYQRITS